MELSYLAADDFGLAEFDFDLLLATLLPDFCESGVALLDLSRSSSESLLSSKKKKKNKHFKYNIRIESLVSKIIYCTKVLYFLY